MQERELGTTGLRVSALGLGTAALSVPYGAPQGEREAPPRAEALATLERALELGVRFVDTAPAYGDAERMIGEVQPPARCVLATKVAIPDRDWAALDDVAMSDHVRRSAEASLRALGREVLDVLAVHNLEPVHAARLAVTLEELRGEGLVRATGATVYGEDAALSAVESFDVVQVAMSPLDARPLASVLPRAAERARGVVVRSALLRGVLTAAGDRMDGPFAPLRAAADAFRADTGATWESLPGAAVAWVAARPGVASVLLGPRDVGGLEGLVRGAAAFSDRAPEGDWGADLHPDLLDPSRWPALEGSI